MSSSSTQPRKRTRRSRRNGNKLGDQKFLVPVAHKKRSLVVSNYINFFPDVIRYKARMMTAQNWPAAATGSITFKGNSFYKTGPQLNYSGSFGDNVPAGLYYLLSPNNLSGISANAGSVAPYSYSRIRASNITVRINLVSQSISSKLIIVPSTYSSFGSVALNTVGEQPGAKIFDIPPSTIKEIVLRSGYVSTDVWGVQPQNVEQTEFSAGVGSDPANLWYWHLAAASLDGTTAYSMQCIFEIDYDVELFSRNVMTSNAPA